jgi:sugar phosphate isomerase/epimerase
MKIGLSTVIYEPFKIPLNEILRRAARMGYEGIELNVKEWPANVDASALRMLLDKLGIEVAAIGTRHMMLTHHVYLSSPRRSVRKKAVEYAKDCVILAEKVGADTIQLGWALQGPRLEAPRKVAWKHAVTSLRIVGRFADERGLCLVLEPANRYEAPLIHRIEESLVMADEVSLENILGMGDTFHMNIEEPSMERSVEKAGKRLKYMHIADSNRAAPGMGHIDFRSLIKSLRKIGYSGYLIMEFIPGQDVDRDLRFAIKTIRKFL